MVTVYYRERIQIKISQYKGCKGHSLERFQTQSCCCPLHGVRTHTLPSQHQHVTMHLAYWQPRKRTWALVSKVFIGVPLLRYDWLIDCSHGWSQSPVWPIPQYPKFPPSITWFVSGMASPPCKTISCGQLHPKQRRFYQVWHCLPELILPPRSQGKGQTSLWARPNCLLHR